MAAGWVGGQPALVAFDARIDDGEYAAFAPHVDLREGNASEAWVTHRASADADYAGAPGPVRCNTGNRCDRAGLAEAILAFRLGEANRYSSPTAAPPQKRRICARFQPRANLRTPRITLVPDAVGETKSGESSLSGLLPLFSVDLGLLS